ncbi:MAG: DNA translocase FtsK [Bacteroidetes bacterium]|nr:DNA translocase FtsK [Bacteroidota bacterium]
MRRKSKHTETTKESAGSRSPLDTKRKLDIIGLLMMAAAFLMLLALISHAHADETVADIGFGDLMRLFGGDQEIQARADTTSNWLGLFGAIIANFFINITVGYFSLVFPVLLMLWGWSILRRKDLRALAYYTNYSLVLVLLFSTFLGLIRLISWMPELSVSWSGNIGDFVGGLISRLIGTTGGVVVILTTIIVLAVVVVDYDIQATFDRGRRLVDWLRMTITGRASALNTAFKAEREAAAMSADAETPVVKDVPAETKSRRKTQPDRPSVAPAPPAPLHVSISRQQEDTEPWTISSVPEQEDGVTPRSNGTISRDAIEGLGGMLGPLRKAAEGRGADSAAAARTPGEAQPGVAARKTVANGSDSETTPARPETAAASKSDDDGDEAIALSDVIANEHERKAVQAAVARKVMQAGAADADALNKELAEVALRYKFPTPDLLDRQVNTNTVSDEELRNKAAQVKEKLSVFGIGIESISVTPGPVVTLFELVPDSSVKISKITSLSDDLALALAAKGIRIIAPIPGKSAVGIEIPNNAPELVNFRSVVTAPEFIKSKHKLTLGLGKSITGDVVCDDLARMPHLLIAGATGSGKSVGINVMITSLLYRMKPSQVKFVMIDPKKIELAQYRGLSKHFLAICPDIDEEIITDPANAVIVLKSLELEMDMRYTKLAKAGVRHVDDYNLKVQNGQVRDNELVKHYQLPYIVVIIDELADLMITAAREVEEPIARLAQLARAVGIHLVVATQRPSVDVITGVIKANFPARIAYQVASRIDSRTVLDGTGADQLLGNGDMLYLPGGQPKPVRIQNAYLSTEEVERVVEFIGDQHGYQRPYTLPSVRSQQKGKSREDDIGTDDLMYEAARLIVRHQQGSVSLLQRRLKIGYSRAARIVDQLEMAGIVGPYDGSKARQVMVEDEDQLEEILQTL